MATLLGSSVGPLLLVLGALLPFLFVQDTIRYVTLVTDRATTALATDALWLAGVVTTLATAGSVIALRTPLFLFGVWCVTGTFAGLVVVLWWRALPRPSAGLGFLRANSDMAGRYTLDTMALTGSSQVSYYLVSAFAGLSSLGAVRGAQALFGPLNVLFSGLFIVVVPEANRVRSKGFGAVVRICVIAGLAMVALGLGLLVALVLMPDSLGEQLLGDTWRSVSAVLVPIGLTSVMNGAAAGAMIGLKAIDNPRAVLAARLWSVPPLLALPAVGAIVNGAVGMSWGLFAASALTCTIFWTALCRSGRVAPHTADETAEADAILGQEMVIASVLEGIVSPVVTHADRVDRAPDDVEDPPKWWPGSSGSGSSHRCSTASPTLRSPEGRSARFRRTGPLRTARGPSALDPTAGVPTERDPTASRRAAHSREALPTRSLSSSTSTASRTSPGPKPRCSAAT